MAAINCHCNYSCHPIEKSHVFVPPAYRCFMPNFIKIGFMAIEEMLFENVDGWTDGWTDGRWIPDYIHMVVRGLLKENYCK